MKRLSLVGLALLGAMAMGGCSGRSGPRRDGGTADAVIPPGVCMGGTAHVTCYGNQSVQCNADNTQGAATDCTANGQTCAPTIGCVTCQPNRFSCTGDGHIQQCNAAGTMLTDTGTVCDASSGQSCNALTGTCVDACAAAAASHSYIGCEYYAVTTSNAQVAPEFLPAIVISNPQAVAVNVN